MTDQTRSRFFSRSSWPLPVTVLVAWAVGAVALPVVRRLTTVVGSRLALSLVPQAQGLPGLKLWGARPWAAGAGRG